MTAFYNEIDGFTADWLEGLIDAGHIAPGVVDRRSIEELQPADLAGFTQCHFFAGIGGWSLALRLAGWPDDRPVWTASLPCQPFSLAGKQLGEDDERHLWEPLHRLIGERRPCCIFGEQVPGAIRLGWLDRVFDDLEADDYACGAVVLPASAVGAPHFRERIYWASHDTRVDGGAHDLLVAGEVGGTPRATRRFPRVSVAGRWWNTDAGPECLPTLVRNHDGLSGTLAGFGNAIVPQLAARFVGAWMDIAKEQP